jgi:hypothetical protein
MEAAHRFSVHCRDVGIEDEDALRDWDEVRADLLRAALALAPIEGTQTEEAG